LHAYRNGLHPEPDASRSLQRFDELDDVTVGVLDEGGPGAGLGLVGRLPDDAVVVDRREGRVDILDHDGDVVPGGAGLELVLAVGVR
jgi:hypothetical protein